MTGHRVRFFAFIFYITSLASGLGHQVDSVELEFLRPEGKWRLEGLLDIAYMMPETRGVDGAPPLFRDQVMDAPEQEHQRIVKTAEQTMRKLLALKYNGKELEWDINFPDFEIEPLDLPPEAGGWALMRVAIDTGEKPGPGKLEIFWNDELESELIVIIEQGENLGLLSIGSGMSATVLELEAPAEGEMVSRAANPSPTARSESWIISGYRNVIPLGPDHLLFILGMFLLAPGWKPLMSQSLLFTFAHSITLALAIHGFISLPPRLIEILIAASIAWIGIENLFLKDLKPSRLFLVFGFGLLHGMGLASAIREKFRDLTGGDVARPLIGFNIGVELAQITVLVCGFLVLWPLRKWTDKVRLIGSIGVALAGLFWMFDRIFP